MFFNILLNACHALAHQGTIRIATGRTANDVWVRISDTGPGIPADVLSQVFDPGFTTKGVGVGTGLGLSICYQIVEEHKGQIRVKSEPGAGASFTVQLPIGPVAPAA